MVCIQLFKLILIVQIAQISITKADISKLIPVFFVTVRTFEHYASN